MTLNLNRYAVIERLRGLDFNPEIPCDANGCESTAQWALTILCPRRHGALYCVPCGARWVRDAKRIVDENAGKAVCTDCPERPPLAAPFWSWEHL